MNPELDDLSKRLRQFALDRDWTRFHAPKNLAAALVVEAGELLEHFQWMPEEQSHRLSPDQLGQVQEEIADVFLYLLQLSDALGVDLFEAARRKIERNAEKYPADRP